MTTIGRQIEIDAPADDVWALLADFGTIHRFNPSVPSSHSTNDIRGEGATRHCDLVGGATLEEVIAAWDEGRSMTVHIVDGTKTPPFKGHPEAVLTVTPKGARSVVHGTLSYELKGGPLGKVMDSTMVRRQFENAWSGLLAGLKRHAETGHAVDSFEAIDGIEVSAA